MPPMVPSAHNTCTHKILSSLCITHRDNFQANGREYHFMENRPHKPLQLVFRAADFAVSLSRNAVCTSTSTITTAALLPARCISQDIQSYVALDVQAIKESDHCHEPESFLDVNKKEIAENIMEEGGYQEFGSEKPAARIFWSFLVDAFKDFKIIILLLSGWLTLGFGIKQNGLKKGWYDGASIIIAVVAVRAIFAIINFKKAGQQMKQTSCVSVHNNTPLEEQLNKLTLYTAKVGVLVDLLVLVVLMICYFIGNISKNTLHEEASHFFSSKRKASDMLNTIVSITAVAVTTVVVAIPEGLPLAVTLILAYSTKRMMATHALVRKLSACATMGSVTAICADKNGIFTLKEMQVAEFWLGKESLREEGSPDIINPHVLELIQQGVGLNITGNIPVSSSIPFPEISCSPTEFATLFWAISHMGLNIQKLKHENEILHVKTFDSGKDRSGILVRNNATSTIYMHWKGAAETILEMCTSYCNKHGTIKDIGDPEKKQLQTIIKDMTDSGLQCIAFAYKESQEECHKNSNDIGLTLLGFGGLKNPCGPEVKAAIDSCRNAGIILKMIIGENISSAASIALECGILKSNEDVNAAIVEGVTFRNSSPEERLEKINRIIVMAESTPLDKLLVVQSLKQKGHVVALIGEGDGDVDALQEADIGLSMGMKGGELAKESSDIVILDDNFNSVEAILKRGRNVYNNIQKFIQFQVTTNVVALLTNFVAAISSGQVPLTAVQLIWANFIISILGALALATENYAPDELMTKKSIGRSEPLITTFMWRNVMGICLYQVTALLILEFHGSTIFGVNENVISTLMFNCFVLCQIFNVLNSRMLEERNVFKGILKNKLFVCVLGTATVVQVILVEFLNRFAGIERLHCVQWAACLGIAALSCPVGWLVKRIFVAS